MFNCDSRIPTPRQLTILPKITNVYSTTSNTANDFHPMSYSLVHHSLYDLVHTTAAFTTYLALAVHTSPRAHMCPYRP